MKNSVVFFSLYLMSSSFSYVKASHQLFQGDTPLFVTNSTQVYNNLHHTQAQLTQARNDVINGIRAAFAPNSGITPAQLISLSESLHVGGTMILDMGGDLRLFFQAHVWRLLHSANISAPLREAAREVLNSPAYNFNENNHDEVMHVQNALSHLYGGGE